MLPEIWQSRIKHSNYYKRYEYHIHIKKPMYNDVMAFKGLTLLLWNNELLRIDAAI